MQCSKCGSPITKETRFCAGCGEALPGTKAMGAGRHSALTADETELAALKELHDQKRRVGIEMRAILDMTKEVGASAADHRRYGELREEWMRLDAEITQQMTSLMERQQGDRRKRPSRSAERRVQQTELRRQERRTGDERRIDDRRSGLDRRDPFPEDLER